MILSSLISSYKFVLVVDGVGAEAQSSRLLQEWITEQQGETGSSCISWPGLLIAGDTLHYEKSRLSADTLPLIETPFKTNVILTPLGSLLHDYNVSSILRTLHKLKNHNDIRQMYLWATTKNIRDEFVVPFVESIANAVLTLKDLTTLTLLTKKPGGSVSFKNYSYFMRDGKYMVNEIKHTIIQKRSDPLAPPEGLGTFKIGLDEHEMKARDALELPYEKAKVIDPVPQGRILYVPDEDDDYDEEDPDDDLDI